MEPEKALEEMRPLAGVQLDESCCEALVAALQGAPALQPRRARNPGNLTEREVEVLRLTSNGSINREIAKGLVISEKTVEHHLEHIFNKLGVTSRTAAVVFAVQHGLAP